ncbi:MAG: type II secretion system protein GspF [Nitrospirae bacterium]|nr:MAG: type II secretion system protein GspF [Nitrospirota bacterium]
MPLFAYRATTRDGVIQEGVINAPDEKTAIEKIKDTGVIPIRISKPGKKERKISFSLRKKPDMLLFTTELSALLSAGLPLDRSLNILSTITEQKSMRAVIEGILKSIREGSSFSEALGQHPEVFPRIYVNMVRAGESGGVLDLVLDKLVEFLETTRQLRENIISAMIYPIILILTGGISLIVLFTYVIPKFARIFEDLGQAIPLPTQMLISFSGFISSWGWLILLVMVLTVYLFRRYTRSPEGRRRWDGYKLKLLGDIIVRLETSRFCRTLGTLLKSGVPLLQALSNVREIITNTVFREAIDQLVTGAREGKGIATPIEKTGIFPPLALSMIRVGEETGQLDEMLLRVADTYEKSLRASVRRFISLLEPALILIMGLVIGFIVISILLAIFSINELPM